MFGLEYPKFKSIPRYNREVTVTEKIDGTNGLIYIDPVYNGLYTGSRNRWISIQDDNYGFASWVDKNKEELLKLGPGHHYGEWYGVGIQRGYGLFERRFALFNTKLWNTENKPKCCDVVPVLWEGNLRNFNDDIATFPFTLKSSVLVPGYNNPEGVVIFHKAAQQYFKYTFDGDGHKSAR